MIVRTDRLDCFDRSDLADRVDLIDLVELVFICFRAPLTDKETSEGIGEEPLRSNRERPDKAPSVWSGDGQISFTFRTRRRG
jgi:hypothetical protein